MLNFTFFNLFKILRKFIKNDDINNRSYKDKANKIFKNLEVASKTRLPAKRIKKILRSSGINLNIKEDEFYLKLVSLFFKNDDLLSSRAFLINKLQKYSSSIAGQKSWLKLRNLFYIKLEIELGAICRKKAINYTSKNKINSILNKKMQARARLEQAVSVKDPKIFFKKYPINFQFDKKIFNSYLSSVYDITLNQKENILENEDKEIFKITNDKNVAFVGPVDVDYNSADEIDSFDVVVRFNYTYPGKDLDSFKKGLKIDISYYNGEQADYIIENNKSKFPDDLKTFCIKDNSKNRVERLKKVNCNKTVRKIDNYNSLNFFNTLHLLPIALLDILKNKPKIIKIFHSDLFLTVNRTSNYFPKSFNRDEMKIRKTLRENILEHDPMCHHEFLKKLFDQGKIIGDKKFTNVMKMETFEYLNKLQDTYS